MSKEIILKAGRTQRDVENDSCDYFRECDTIKEAKQKLEFVSNGGGKRERYLFSRGYQAISEASEPLRYAQIVVNDEVIQDFFSKGYNGEPRDME